MENNEIEVPAAESPERNAVDSAAAQPSVETQTAPAASAIEEPAVETSPLPVPSAHPDRNDCKRFRAEDVPSAQTPDTRQIFEEKLTELENRIAKLEHPHQTMHEEFEAFKERLHQVGIRLL